MLLLPSNFSLFLRFSHQILSKTQIPMANGRNAEAFGYRIGVLSGWIATSLESLISYVFSLSLSRKKIKQIYAELYLYVDG